MNVSSDYSTHRWKKMNRYSMSIVNRYSTVPLRAVNDRGQVVGQDNLEWL
jgi:hypothetical protein